MKSFLSIFAIFLLSCSQQKNLPASQKTSSLLPDGKLWSSLFQQKAAEYNALCLQAYAIARLRLDQAIAIPAQKPRVIITDIDETFLDNSPYAVHQALAGKDYEAASWYDWTGRGVADTLSGALGLFRYAESKNVAVYYITNREEKERAGTLQNLLRYNFPFADNEHLIMRKDISSKELRRQAVAKGHEIVLLLGDNLADFSSLFDKKSTAERTEQVRQLAAEFGNRFIVLPNANYGGWEDAIYLNERNWTMAQKDSLIRAAVKSY